MRNPVKILLLASEESVLATAEFKQIIDELERGTHWPAFDVDQRHGVYDDEFTRVLQVPRTIVHFSVHGETEGQLVFATREGGRRYISTETIATALRQTKGLRCVILNACFSAEQALKLATDIDVVIGMRGEVSNEAAQAFSVGFYRALAVGNSAKAAYELGKLQVEIRCGPDTSSIAELHTRAGLDPEDMFRTWEPYTLAVAQLRRARLRKWAMSMAAVVVVTLVFVYLYVDADRQRSAAERATVRAESLHMFSEAQRLDRDQECGLAMQLIERAVAGTSEIDQDAIRLIYEYECSSGLFKTLEAKVHAMSPTPTGALLVSHGEERLTLYSPTARVLATGEGRLEKSDNLTWANSGELALRARPGAAHLITISDDAITMTPIEVAASGPVALAPSGGSFAVGSSPVTMFERRGDEWLARPIEFEELPDAEWTALAWSPDGEKLALGAGDGQLHVLDVATSTTTSPTEQGSSQVNKVAWSVDGRYLAVVSTGGVRALAFDERDGLSRPVWTGLSTTDPRTRAEWNPRRAVLAVAADDRLSIVDLDLSGPTLLDCAQFRALAWNPTGTLLAASCRRAGDHNSRNVRVWDLDGELEVDIRGGDKEILGLWWLLDGPTWPRPDHDIVALTRPDELGIWPLGLARVLEGTAALDRGDLRRSCCRNRIDVGPCASHSCD